MTETVVCGIDHHREWMLQVIACDCATGARSDFMWFFNTREEAETHCEKLTSIKAGENMIIKFVKVRAFEYLGSGFERVEKEN